MTGCRRLETALFPGVRDPAAELGGQELQSSVDLRRARDVRVLTQDQRRLPRRFV